MKNDHATKKQKKQTWAKAAPMDSEQRPATEFTGSQPATFNLQPATDPARTQQTDEFPKGPQRRRNGDIARLPKQVRQQVNEMLDDGLRYPQVIANLGEAGGDLTPRAVMSWTNGGY